MVLECVRCVRDVVAQVWDMSTCYTVPRYSTERYKHSSFFFNFVVTGESMSVTKD